MRAIYKLAVHGNGNAIANQDVILKIKPIVVINEYVIANLEATPPVLKNS